MDRPPWNSIASFNSTVTGNDGSGNATLAVNVSQISASPDSLVQGTAPNTVDAS